MSVIAKKTKTFPPPPKGAVEAVLVDVEDLGEQTSVWGTAHKIKLVFELDPDAGLRDDGKRHVISSMYTLSLHEASNLSKHLSAWGVELGDADSFDVCMLIGDPALLVLKHVEGKEGRTFARLETIIPAQKKLIASGDYRRKDGSEPAMKTTADGGDDPDFDWDSGTEKAG